MVRTVRSLLVLLALVALVVPAASEDLEDLLTDVGEQYARGYTAPLIHAWGANQNSALYHTAAIPRSRLTISFGIKMMATHISEDDQTFRSVYENVALSDFLPSDHPYHDQTGDVVMQGPTVFGDTETMGTLTAYAGGLPVYQVETIEGLIDTRWVPLAAPQLEVGGIMGLRGTLRWLPEVDAGDYGKTKYLGYGVAWSPNALLPTLPVDVMVGYFSQEIDVGTIVETDASSLYLAASRSFGPLIGYVGVASESSSMDVAYTVEDDGYAEDVEVAFAVDGEMENRFTLGATLDTPLKLNAEINVGTLTVFSAGLMAGF